MTRDKRINGPCAIEGCPRTGRFRKMCRVHYQEWAAIHSPDILYAKAHPLRAMWEDRKYSGALCPEWHADFRQFVRDVGEKMDGNFILCRLTADKPYGPDNFVWKQHLRREEGEGQRAWNLRMRRHQIEKFPTFERGRELRRKYGITIGQYEEMNKAQGGRCAICNNEEDRHEHRTGNRRKLAVDHCHKTSMVRGLLCWDCNVTLGRVDESIERLRAMIAYIEKHQRPELKDVSSG